MIKLAFEFPLPHWREFKAIQDFTFGLAQYILTDEEYRKKMIPIELLDNGVHENGEPLSLKDLGRAITLCRPLHVVSPDWFHDMKKTKAALMPASFELESELCAVVQGQTIDEVKELFEFYLQQELSIIAFPYRADRCSWIQELRRSGLWKEDQWYHMMGLKDADELHDLVQLDMKFASLDTSKPIKAGIHGTSLNEVAGLGPLDIHQTLTDDQLERALEMCQAMKEVCQ